MSAVDPVARLVEVDDRVRALKQELADAQTERDAVEEAVVALFVEEGTQSVKSDQGVTVYLHRTLWPAMREGRGREDVIAALEACGHGALVQPNYNSNAFAALVRECARDGDLPEALGNVVEVSTRVEARVRRGDAPGVVAAEQKSAT